MRVVGCYPLGNGELGVVCKLAERGRREAEQDGEGMGPREGTDEGKELKEEAEELPVLPRWGEPVLNEGHGYGDLLLSVCRSEYLYS